MSHLAFSYNSVIPSSAPQLLAGLPSASPNPSSLSNPSLSPPAVPSLVGSDDGRSPSSPPLTMPPSSLSYPGVPHPPPHSVAFSAAAAAAAAASRLPGGVMSLAPSSTAADSPHHPHHHRPSLPPGLQSAVAAAAAAAAAAGVIDPMGPGGAAAAGGLVRSSSVGSSGSSGHHQPPITSSSSSGSLGGSVPPGHPGSPPCSSASGGPLPPPHPLDPGQFLSDPSNLTSHLAAYPRLAAAGGGLGMAALGAMAAAAPGGLPYAAAAAAASNEQNPYTSLAMENFYNPLTNPYSIKDGTGPPEMSSPWAASSLAAAGYYPYDTSALAAYGYGGAYGLAATRKNVTRESTATLKAWLNEHKKNPYPTKGEKIMLAIISKMTLTQVSCWFANARRRLKKENKMTWEPKNGLNDEDVDVSDEEDNDASFKEEKVHHPDADDPRGPSWVVGPTGHVSPVTEPHLTASTPQHTSPGAQDKDGVPLPPSKPRIWSMAELAVSKSSYVGCG